MPKEPKLANPLGLGKDDIEAALRQEILDAAEIVAEEFRRVLSQLQADSADGVFDGYEVTLDIKPTRITKPHLGTLNVPQVHIYVQSPDPKLNVFDILDAGRPSLPGRGSDDSPYPMWGINIYRQVGRPGETRRRKGKFAISAPPSSHRGSRPEKLRYKLMGSRPDHPQYSPMMFTRAPIQAVPPADLYKRIYDTVKPKLKRQGFKNFELILAQRKS